MPPITLLWLGGERAAGEPLPSRTTLEAELPGRIAAAVTRLLGQGVVLRQGSERRPLRRADLCILVSTHDQAERLRSALERRGLASRLVSKADVFASPAALALQRLLDALADPADQGRLRLLAASPLLAWSAARIATTSADGWSDLAGELERLARRLGSSGPIGVINALLDSEALARLAVGGRLLADLQQLAMLVQERLHADQLGPAAAADWLRRLRLDEDRLVPEEHQAHSDRADGAISVVTVHRSKGLEFPVVFCPYLWQAPSPGNQRLALRWQPGGSAAPRLSLQVDRRWGEGWQAACQSLQAEEAERERLAYVAMTRARHLLVLAWGPAAEQGSNPLQSWLLPSAGLGDGGGSGSGRACSDDEWRQAIAETIAERRLPISFEEAPAADDPVQAPAEARSAAEWHVGPVPQRRLDSLWGRSSYTSWTQGRHGLAQDPANREAGRDTADPAVDLELPPAAGVTTSAASAAGEVGRRGAVATAPQLAAGAAACAAPGQVASTPERADGSPGDGDSAGPAPWLQNGPLAAFPRGSGAGDCLHRILEQVDYQRPLASEDNRQVAQRELRRAGFADQPLEPLLDGLERLRHTPFGGALGDWRLAGLPRCQRLNELAFDLTLSLVRAADLAAVFSAHPGGGCDAAYGQRLAQLPVESCGFLTGSIDLACPIPAAGGQPRWWVIDWKSNWLGERDAQGQPRACGPRHYAQAAMAELMRSNHYHLQAHLYLVALHRYLRWRLPDYAPQRHLGGYAYVFLRGVPGPLAAVAPGEAIPGIYQDSPPLERLLALDALFGGAR